jgi:predicted transcriptional regulator
VVSRKQASRDDVRHLLRRFFGNSAEALVLNLLEDEELSQVEIKRIERLLKEEK